jgi:signal transduction histidine kinase/FixJ family two-component response regulator
LTLRPRPERILAYREYPILYVDDEPENLRIFELMFRREFQIQTATSGDEALEILNRHPIALVLSDHRMPGLTGVDFLSRVRELNAATVRILVTAYGDVETLQGAINSGSIYRFVPKPWSPEEMRVTLRNGIEMYALERDRSELLRELSLLGRISKSMNQQLALEPLLELLLDSVIDDLGYDAAGILFVRPKEEILAWGQLSPKDSPVSKSLKGMTIARRSAPDFVGRLLDGESQLLSMGSMLDFEGPVKEWVAEVAAEEIFVAPLIGKTGVVGALAVDNRRGGAPFGADDRHLLEGLTTHAVVAIENARMVEDLRRSREQIVRADRLGTLGTLAAGLAHEINNPLVSIHTFLSMAPDKREEQDSEFWGDYHQLACREVDRIRRLVDTMRRLGRGSSGDAPRVTVDPGELVQGVVKLLQREAGKAEVVLAVHRDPNTPKIVAIRDHLQQLFMNLLLNGIQASPRGGTVEARVFAERGGEAVCIEIRDEGPGVPEEDLERIFDPFFTTKGPDQGTGLGLMICHRLVADHRGQIEVSNPPGAGASFLVRLPIGDEHGNPDQPHSLDPLI